MFPKLLETMGQLIMNQCKGKFRTQSNESILHSCIQQLCVKSVRIQNYSGPHFPAFGLNTESDTRIQSECGKMRTRITPNTDTFYEVNIAKTRCLKKCFKDCLQISLLKLIEVLRINFCSISGEQKLINLLKFTQC